VDEISDAYSTDDGDLHIYVGTSGCDVMVKDICPSPTNEPIVCCRLSTGPQAVADKLEEIIQPMLGYSPFLKDPIQKLDGNLPKYPFFSGVDDPIVRTLFSMIVRCTACPGGLEGEGPKKVSPFLRKHEGMPGTFFP
jgi:hypothetical protein